MTFPHLPPNFNQTNSLSRGNSVGVLSEEESNPEIKFRRRSSVFSNIPYSSIPMMSDEQSHGSSTSVRRKSIIKPLDGMNRESLPRIIKKSKRAKRPIRKDSIYSLEEIGRRGRASLGQLPIALASLYQNSSNPRDSSWKFTALLKTLFSSISFYLIFKLLLPSSFHLFSNFVSNSNPNPHSPSQSPRNIEFIQNEMRKATMVKFRNLNLWRTDSESLTTAIIPQIDEHEFTMIFLHGLGQTSADAEIIPNILAIHFKTVRWVLPVATAQPITFYNQELKTSWFDLKNIPDVSKEREDEEGIFKSVRQLNSLIRRERSILISDMRSSTVHDHTILGPETQSEQIWASKRIILAGFSQGSAISLFTALTHEYELAGIASFSGWLPLKDRITYITTGLGNRYTLPIFYAHGIRDSIVLPSESKQSLSILRQPRPHGLFLSNIEERLDYDIGHEIWWSQSGLEIVDFKKWLVSLGVTSSAIEIESEVEGKRMNSRRGKRLQGYEEESL